MANLKELSKQPERLTGGHRLCAGCGASIAVRMILHATDKPIVASTATGCLEVATTIYPYTAWNIPWIHNAFENTAATISGVETAYRALKKKGKIKEDIRFIAFGGDGGTYDIGLQSLSGMLERRHKCVYVCYDNGAYMNCISTSSVIFTKRGPKKITDVLVGEEVYAFDLKTYQLVTKKCTGIYNNGMKEIFRLKTRYHTIEATDNHPFLVLKRNGRGKKNTLIWKTLSEIKPGDEVVVLKNINPGKSYNFEFNPVKKGDYKVNKLNEVDLPHQSNPDLMKYLGLFVGDGWTREQKGEIGFALPENSEERRVFLDLHSKIFGGSVRTDSMYVYVNSVNIARFLNSLYFGNGAKHKTIPGWVFTLPKEEKEAFVEGLLLSDGYRFGNRFRYVSASKELISSLKLLLQTMEYRVGKIHFQTKKKGKNVVQRKLLKDSTYGYICFSKKKRKNVTKYLSQSKYANFLVGNKFFEMEKVISVEPIGKGPTLDLRVEDEHNFIADGIVVHNTGIQRSGSTPFGANTTTSPVGKIKQGKEHFRKDLLGIVAAHNIPYAAQATIASWNDLITKAQKAFEADGPAFINVLSPCLRGWRFPQDQAVTIAKLAVETGIWPLIEVVNGKWKITYKPKQRKPVIEWFKAQGRFKHLLKPENHHIVEKIQQHIDEEWKRLEKLESL